jgi:hypothetical protein
MNIGEYQNNIAGLDKISEERYENIFKLYKAENGSKEYYFYNILNKINIPPVIDEGIIGYFVLDTKIPWTTFSYKIYQTQHLWWLLFLINKPENIFYADGGVRYKYILPDYINDILLSIQNQLQ